MRSKWSISGPKAFSKRKAISGVSAALPWRRSESVAHFQISAALVTLRPRPSMISALMRSSDDADSPYCNRSRVNIAGDEPNVPAVTEHWYPQPADSRRMPPVQRRFAQTVADSQWRINRIRSIEDGMLSIGDFDSLSAK